ncbi:MAG TPA: TetR/AcrR family transcriptional regulator [Scandinavium sp.]|uniref:TetR/AcrR family transcriptional regulator n=1 Tax=Scandinavium sp. TaxID=2830653 RepID=UPI002E30BA2C|nr:TetR/AcrR family transcriptional regulator [Scandinavium sp.]HEX4502687.1 TetR/AcrR family transcriptional regulator [Scandinavium sp.]
MRTAILDSLTAMITEGCGLAHIPIERLAKHAGVSKTTIYKWWPGKEDIFCEAFFHWTDNHLPTLAFADHGAETFFQQFLLRATEIRQFHRGAIARTMLGLTLEHDAIAQQFQQNYQLPRYQAMQRSLQEWLGTEAKREDISLFLDLTFSLIYNFSSPNIAQTDAHLCEEITRVFHLIFPQVTLRQVNDN